MTHNTTFPINTKLALSLAGTSYIIYTTEGEYPRQSQPCYGELRKYEKTHKGECTQPENSKPGDLHSPFPNGTPEAIVIPFPRITPKSSDTDIVFRAMFSKDSPWYSGFNDVTFFMTEKGFIGGVIIEDVKIDTTVLVNCLKTMQNFHNVQMVKDFVDLIGFGSTEAEALAIVMLNSVAPSSGVGYTDSYKAPVQFSAKRFFNRTPNDLTGGYFRDRIDYNRTDMHKPFWGDEGFIQWNKKTFPTIPEMTYTKPTPEARLERLKVFSIKAREVFQEALAAEPDPVLKPFVWKTTSGKTSEKNDTIAA